MAIAGAAGAPAVLLVELERGTSLAAIAGAVEIVGVLLVELESDG